MPQYTQAVDDCAGSEIGLPTLDPVLFGDGTVNLQMIEGCASQPTALPDFDPGFLSGGTASTWSAEQDVRKDGTVIESAAPGLEKWQRSDAVIAGLNMLVQGGHGELSESEVLFVLKNYTTAYKAGLPLL